MSADWLPATIDPKVGTAIRYALDNLGVLELPPGSNRSPRIDAWMAAVASPLGESWCAAFLAGVYRRSALPFPPSSAGAVHVWREWAQANGTWSPADPADPGPEVGDAVVYDFAGDGQGDHIGIVVRTDPLILTVEGNTDITGSREGIGVFLQDRRGKGVLGYIMPRP